MQGLQASSEDVLKAWFIEIDKIFTEKNLKIFYLPFATLDKVLRTLSFKKLPDPKYYLVGISIIRGLGKTDSADLPTFKKRLKETSKFFQKII